MDLDIAIKYYSNLADDCRRKASPERNDYMDLKDLAAEHGQLADWLIELKVLREKIRLLLEKQDRWIPVTERLPEEDDYRPCYGYDDGAVWWLNDIGMMGLGWYYASTEKWAFYDEITHVEGIVGNVVAWRPIHEPYTEEDND